MNPFVGNFIEFLNIIASLRQWRTKKDEF